MAETILIEASPWIVSTGAAASIALAGGGVKGYTHRSRSDWLAGVIRLPKFSSAMEFTENGFSGGARPEFGELKFMPGAKATLDSLASYLWNGADVEVFIGDDEDAVPVWTTIIKGVIQSQRIEAGVLNLTIRDASGDLDTSVAQDRFDGSGGLEGEAVATERLKRRSFGACSNVEAFPLKPSTLVFEVGDPAFQLNAISDVKDMGRSASSLITVAWQGTAVATLAALEAQAAPQGGGVVAPSIACVKWWTSPVGPLTVDLEGEIGAGYVDTAAELASRVIATRSTVTISNEAAAAIWRPGKAGIHLNQSNESISQALDRLLKGSSLAWASNADGTIRLSEIALSNPSETVKIVNVGRSRSFRPLKRRRVGYRRNHRIHSDGEISAALRDSDGGALISGATFYTPPPSVAPSLAIDFLRSQIIDPRIAFTRATVATYWGADGRLKTAAIDEPRFDHDPLTGEPLGLLREPAATNLCLHSSDLANAAWVKTNCTAAKTATGPDAAANSASTVTATAANATCLQAITNASANRVASCFIKRRTGTGAIEITQDNGATWTPIAVTAAWARFEIAPATLANPTVGLRIVTSGDEVDVAIFQSETGADTTSAIETVASSVTRAADVAPITGAGFSDAYDVNGGALFVHARPKRAGKVEALVSVNDGGTANRTTLRLTPSSAAGLFVRDAGVTQAIIATGAVVADQDIRIAGRFAVNDFIVSADGEISAQDNSGTMPTVDRITLGAEGNGIEPFLGHIKEVRLYPPGITDADLQSLTAFPVPVATGDQWSDGSGANLARIWSGTDWILARDGSVTDALSGAVNKLVPIEDSADVTKLIKDVPSEIIVQYDSAGVAKPGQLPKVTAVKLFTSADVQVTSGITWSVTTVSGTISASITGTGAGNLSATSLTTDEAVVTVKAILDGRAYTETIKYIRQQDPPDPGSGAQQAPISGTIPSSGAWTTVGTVPVTAGAGGTIELRTGSVTLTPAIIQSIATTDIKAKLQWESSPGVWTDLGVVTFSDPDPKEINEGEGFWSELPGSITADPFDHTGRTNGVEYNYRLQMAYNSGALRSVFPTGTLTGTPT